MSLNITPHSWLYFPTLLKRLKQGDDPSLAPTIIFAHSHDPPGLCFPVFIDELLRPCPRRPCSWALGRMPPGLSKDTAPQTFLLSLHPRFLTLCKIISISLQALCYFFFIKFLKNNTHTLIQLSDPFLRFHSITLFLIHAPPAPFLLQPLPLAMLRSGLQRPPITKSACAE